MSTNMPTEKQPKTAYETLVRYLASAAHSEREVKNRLYEKGFHKAEVDEAISKAKERGYVDDEEYVRVYIKCKGGKLGRKMLTYKLTTEKGIDKSLAESVADEMLNEEDEREKALSVAEKYIRIKHLEDTRADRDKAGAYLYGRGFNYTVINEVLTKAFSPDVNEDN